MGFLDDLEAASVTIASETAQLLRIAGLGNWGTAGPDNRPPEIPAPLPPMVPPVATWTDGWWNRAKHMPAHPGRVGRIIQAVATGLHTCDMLPSEWNALILAWTTKPGDGAGANFLLGRDEAHGVVQFIPITHNSNSLGGPGHGVFLINGIETHPNLVTNSIEIHCAGGVRKVNGQWRLVEDGQAHGEALPDEDVIPDPIRPGRGWHKITDYQYAMAAALLDDLNAVQAPLPASTTTRAYGEAVPSWATRSSRRVVGHVELDPVHRSDPWNHGMAWLRARLP